MNKKIKNRISKKIIIRYTRDIIFSLFSYALLVFLFTIIVVLVKSYIINTTFNTELINFISNPFYKFAICTISLAVLLTHIIILIIMINFESIFETNTENDEDNKSTLG